MDQNKTGLFAYLFKEVLLHPDDDMILTCACDITSITNANQMVSTFICTVDTDVLVVVVSVFARLKDQLEELWVDFRVGEHRKYVPVQVISINLAESRAHGLSFSHAFTGCGQFSFTKVTK